MLELDSLDSSPSRDGADYSDPKVEIFYTIFDIYRSINQLQGGSKCFVNQ